MLPDDGNIDGVLVVTSKCFLEATAWVDPFPAQHICTVKSKQIQMPQLISSCPPGAQWSCRMSDLALNNVPLIDV